MIIDLVRHGETDRNNEGRLQGQIDIPLNTTGINQAQLIAKRLKEEEYDIIFTSELSRAQDTMYAIHTYHPSTKIVIDPLLNERSFGEFEGKISKNMDWEALKGNTLEKTPPGGESINDHIVRTQIFLNKLESLNKKILIVCHGGVIRSIVHSITKENPIEIRPVNTAYYRIEKKESKYSIVINNSNSHLVGDTKGGIESF